MESSFLNPVKAIAAAKLHEGMRVADFGAGSGFFTRAAGRAVGKSGVVWAVEIHRELLSHIKNLSLAEGLENVEVLYGDVEKSKGSHLEEESFDLVIAANIFFSADHKEGIVEEIRRVLKKGGMALVIDWQDSFGGMGPDPAQIVGSEDIAKLFEAHGFAPAGDVPAGAYHWGLLLRKKQK